MKSLESLLEQSKQPYCYLIETIREKDFKISSLQEQQTRLSRELESLKKDRHRLISTKNQMALDLEKLLSHNEVSAYSLLDQFMVVLLYVGASKDETVIILSECTTPYCGNW